MTVILRNYLRFFDTNRQRVLANYIKKDYIKNNLESQNILSVNPDAEQA